MFATVSPFIAATSPRRTTFQENQSTPKQTAYSPLTTANDSISFKGRNPLHVAAEANNYLEIQELTEGGVSPDELNEQDENGNTPLHLAALNNAKKAVRVLLGKPHILRTPENNKGQTPYMLAQDETVKRLLNYGQER